MGQEAQLTLISHLVGLEPPISHVALPIYLWAECTPQWISTIWFTACSGHTKGEHRKQLFATRDIIEQRDCGGHHFGFDPACIQRHTVRNDKQTDRRVVDRA